MCKSDQIPAAGAAPSFVRVDAERLTQLSGQSSMDRGRGGRGGSAGVALSGCVGDADEADRRLVPPYVCVLRARVCV